jgi:outer membrane receptor protein involved in Fe transport
MALSCASIVLFSPTAFSGSLRADETNEPNVESVMDMDLEDLVKVRVRIASIDAKPIESQPAVVAVITAKEIESSGAKDLKDILQLVPGFTAGLDVCGAVGPGFRGIWAYEGKVQVLVDGIEMNEGYFGNILTLDRFAAANIKQVEILRGPGSAMYGGTAEMAVISITTKGAELDGGFVSERLVFHGDDFGHEVASSFGYHLTSKWAVFGNLATGQLAPSDQKYQSPDGAVERDLHGNMKTRPLELNLGMGSPKAEVRILYNRYQVQDQILYGFTPFVTPQGLPGQTENNIFAVSAKGNVELTSRLSTAPRAIYRYESPWWMDYGGTGTILHRNYHRLDLDLPAMIKVSNSSKLVVGVHYYHEYSRALAVGGRPFDSLGIRADNYFLGTDHIARDDFAAYAQYDLDTRWVNLTLGGRYEYYSYSGGTFVPRVGLVKAWERFHIKALYSQSFRTPNLGMVTDSPIRLKDEFTTTYEVEAGYRLNGGFSVTGNAYHVRIENLIGYEPGADRYANGAPMSTEGVELQARYTSEKLATYVGYSYNRAVDQGFDLYSANPALGHLNLNMPAHQVVWSGNWHITRALNWNVSGTFLDRRAAYAYPDANTPSILNREVLLHTYVDYQWRQFDLGLGVRDLLDVKEMIGQPYNGGAGPLPLSGRTFFAQLGIRFQDGEVQPKH